MQNIREKHNCEMRFIDTKKSLKCQFVPYYEGMAKKLNVRLFLVPL